MSREKYNIYCEMYDAIPDLERRIKESLQRRKFSNIYCVFLSVADEDKRAYFCDIEYSNGTSDSYNRIYGTYTLDKIEKFIERK